MKGQIINFTLQILFMASTDSIPVKALFYIEPKEPHNRVQHIGCRLLITEKLIHAGFTKGGAFNLPDGRVEVVLEGEKKDIETFYIDIQKHLIKLLEARTDDKDRLKEMIGNPGITLTKIEFNSNIRVLDIGLYSHSLEMAQLEKGVDAYYDLTNAIKKLTIVLDKNLKP
ncbi:acylphosphatase [Candidatus Micrarchaeota archaeon]|nr:acylphosphatase [Candidatus Micrarchaeota archaeon]